MKAVPSKVVVLETVAFAWSELRQNWRRAVLTSLGMVVGTASFILVVTAGITGRDYILRQIQGVGSNLIYAHYEIGETAAGSRTLSDHLTLGDLRAIRSQIAGVRDATAVVLDSDSIVLGNAPRVITVIGTTAEYRSVRNIEVLEGRFIDAKDDAFRNKVCLITKPLRDRLRLDPSYRGYLTLYGLRFDVIGVFRERVNTFGQSEVTDYSALIPLSLMRYFKGSDAVDQLYASAVSLELVPKVTADIRRLLKARHRQESVYRVDNLTEILKTAKRVSLGLTLVLLVIGGISLTSGGIGIMNVMLITVSERTREIGLKKAVGASRTTLLLEFLSEALMLSVTGGTIGTLVGCAIPYSVRLLAPAIRIDVPGFAIVLGFSVTLLVGLTFGLLPASKASRLNPVEALRYE